MNLEIRTVLIFDGFKAILENSSAVANATSTLEVL